TLGLGGISKVVRLGLQSGVLAIGAWLVIEQQATAGIIIAASILSARALAPVELAIANWRGFVRARPSWRRLAEAPGRSTATPALVTLRRPNGHLKVEALVGAPSNSRRLVVQDLGFSLQAGQGLGIVGPSGSGKSSLARLIVGVWRPLRGSVRIDGASLDQWQPCALGRHLRSLPPD